MNSNLGFTSKSPFITFIVTQRENTTDQQLCDTMESIQNQPIEVETILMEKGQNLQEALRMGSKKSTGAYVFWMEAGNTITDDFCQMLQEKIEGGADQIRIWCALEDGYNADPIKTALSRAMNASFPKETDLECPRLWYHALEDRNYMPLLANKVIKKELWNRVLEQATDDYREKDVWMLQMQCLLDAGTKNIVFCEEKLLQYSLFSNPERYTIEDSIFNELIRLYQDRSFYEKMNPPCVEYARRTIMKYMVWVWMKRIALSVSGRIFDVLYKELGEQFLFGLSRFAGMEKAAIAARIQDAQVLRPQKGGKIRKIGLCYHAIENGGIQRVIALLSWLFKEYGYEVTLFLNQKPTENSYDLPDNTTCIILPDERIYKDKDYEIRGKVLREKIIEEQIDVFIGEKFFSGQLIWDMLNVKSLGIPFVVHVHNIDAILFELRSPITQIGIYPLIDGFVVLSQVEKKFFERYAPTYYIPNPLTFSLEETEYSWKKESKEILWLARLDEVKNPQHMLMAFAKVIPQVPEAHLSFVGSGDPQIELSLREGIEKLGLQNHVSLCGFTKHVEEYYKKAALFVMTSFYEGFPMTLLESKAFGIPTIIYNLPYLELIRENKGMSIVEKGNIDLLADEIIRLLKDDEERERLSLEARASVENITSKIIMEKWQEVFAALEQDIPYHACDADRIMMENIMEHHRIGMRKEIDKETRNATVKIQEIQEILKKTNDEKSEVNRKLQIAYDEKSEISRKLQIAYDEKSEINRKLQITYDEKAERGIIINEQKNQLIDMKEQMKVLEERVKILDEQLKKKTGVLLYQKLKSRLKNAVVRKKD